MEQDKMNYKILLEIEDVEGMTVNGVLDRVVIAVKQWGASSDPSHPMWPSNFGSVIATNIPSHSRKTRP